MDALGFELLATLYKIVHGDIARANTRVISLSKLVHGNIARLNAAWAWIFGAIRNDGASDRPYTKTKKSRNVSNDEERHFAGRVRMVEE